MRRAYRGERSVDVLSTRNENIPIISGTAISVTRGIDGPRERPPISDRHQDTAKTFQIQSREPRCNKEVRCRDILWLWKIKRTSEWSPPSVTTRRPFLAWVEISAATVLLTLELKSTESETF
jgi:hypothetical protein